VRFDVKKLVLNKLLVSMLLPLNGRGYGTILFKSGHAIL